jgi:1,4-alpha-glucan branching enzyme
MNNEIMKTRKKSRPAATPTGGRKVRLAHRAPEAKRVCVIGSFNRWQPDAAPMQQRADGLWTVELELSPGTYDARRCVLRSDSKLARTTSGTRSNHG